MPEVDDGFDEGRASWRTAERVGDDYEVIAIEVEMCPVVSSRRSYCLRLLELSTAHVPPIHLRVNRVVLP